MKIRHAGFLKRCAALALALLLSSALALPAFGAEPGLLNLKRKVREYTEGMFPDVAEDRWYAVSVCSVYELGLMQGGTDGLFHPDDGVTLAETAALAARIHLNYNTGSAEFTQGKPWYQVYVDYCRENGLITEDYADYDRQACRSEFAAILSRTVPASALPAFNEIADGAIPDVPADSENAAEIYLLYRAGILTGNDVYGTFSPASDIKRSEVAAIVSRIAYTALRKPVQLIPKPAFPDLAEGPRQDDDFFADAAMIGNSLVDGMMLYSGLKMSYFGQESATVKSYRLDRLLQGSYGKVYIELGINDMGYGQETYIDGYRDIVQRIRAAMPDADIYILSMTPVTKAKAADGFFSMNEITARNAALYALAEELQCWYIDCCTPLCGSDGYLRPDLAATWDGAHLRETEGYVAWAEIIRTHYAQ